MYLSGGLTFIAGWLTGVLSAILFVRHLLLSRGSI